MRSMARVADAFALFSSFFAFVSAMSMSSGGAEASGSGSESGGSSVMSEGRQLTQRAGESKQEFTERKQEFEQMKEQHAILLVTLQEAQEAVAHAVQVSKDALAAVKASEQRILDVVRDVTQHMENVEEAQLD